MKKKITNQMLFKIILIIYVIYSTIFIYQTSFIINDQRYFSLNDDIMISMKYAKNLASGSSLVWEKGGERVEGYTNLLWVLYMALFHLFSIPISKISLFIQISGLLFLILNLFVVKKIAGFISNNSGFICITSVFFTAFYFSLNYWSFDGFEVSALVLLINVSVLLIIKAQNQNKFTFIPYLLLGLGTLFRPDMVIPYLAVIIYQFISTANNRIKTALYTLIPLILFLSVQTLFRWFYYGELLPNTYYLKMTGYPFFLRLSRGLIVFSNFAWKTNWILFLMPITLIFSKKYKFLKLLFLIILGQIFYSIYIGGDAWVWLGACNRFIVIAMPLFFILFSLSVSEVLNHIKHQLSIKSEPVRLKIYLFLFLLLSLFSFNSLNGLDWLLFKPSVETLVRKSRLELGLHIKEFTKPKAKVAVVLAGTMPYFVDRRYVDLLGKNDKKIARGEMRTFDDSENLFPFNNITNTKYTFFYPGHLKWNFSRSIGRLKPDVIVALWGDIKEAIPYLEKDYVKINYKGYQIILRKNSEFIDWDKTGPPIEQDRGQFSN